MKSNLTIKKENIVSKKYSCNFCSKGLSSRYEKELHIKQEHKDLPQLKCDICNVKFLDEDRRKQHMSIVHEGMDKTSEDTKFKSCDVCDKTFKNSVDLQTHVKKEH